MPKRTRTTNPKLVVAYVRMSTSDQPNSPAAQADAIERFASRHDLRIVGWYEDRGVSGAKPAMDRSGFASAIDALAQHGAGALIIAKRDRLGRDTIEVGLATRLVERMGARVLASDGTGNGDAPEDKLLCGIVDVFAAYAESGVMRSRGVGAGSAAA